MSFFFSKKSICHRLYMYAVTYVRMNHGAHAIEKTEEKQKQKKEKDQAVLDWVENPMAGHRCKGGSESEEFAWFERLNIHV